MHAPRARISHMHTAHACRARVQACLRHFQLPDGSGGHVPMKQVFSVEEIHKGNKAGHFRNIAQAGCNHH